MFAELGDDTASSRIVEGQVVQSSAAPPDAANTTPDDWDGVVEPDAFGGGSAFAETIGEPESAYGTHSPDSGATAHQHEREQPVTLEELEGAYSGSGFRAIELQPGELALLAGQSGRDSGADGAGLEEPRLLVEERDDAFAPTPAHAQAATDAAQAPVAPAPAPAQPAPEPAPVEREPEGYAERLARARRRRDDGALPDAVSDYRLILKNAPDLLPQVLGDLDELLAEHADQPEVHRLVGDARIRQGDYLSAIEAYNRAVALSQAQND